MKNKILGILIGMLFIATAIPVLGFSSENRIQIDFQINQDGFNEAVTPFTTYKSSCDGIFLQLPADPEDSWTGPFSDIQQGYQVFDDFGGITEPICDIHWWGFCLAFNGTNWIPGNPDGMVFNITFHIDDGSGKPGTIIGSYLNVTPTITPTGIFYETSNNDLFELHYFHELNTGICHDLPDGWVSVIKTYSPSDCMFAWMDSYDGNNQYLQKTLSSGDWTTLSPDVSFVLVDYGSDVPNLYCLGDLNWNDIIPGEEVNGEFTICNNGEEGSVLHWKIDEYPDWGSNWTFTPNVGILTTDDDWITIDVSFIAPDKKNSEFSGEIKVINIINSSDYCMIDVSLATPKNKHYNINSLFINFLKQHPALFPIIRQKLGL